MGGITSNEFVLSEVRAKGPNRQWIPSSPLLDRHCSPTGRTKIRRSARPSIMVIILAAVLVAVPGGVLLSSMTASNDLAADVQGTYDHDVSVVTFAPGSGSIEPGQVVVNATVENTGNLTSGPFQVNLTIFQTDLPVTVFSDGFETGSVPPTGWVDFSTGSQIWVTTNNGPQSGVRCLVARQELYGSALLGSPAITLPYAEAPTLPGDFPPYVTQCSSVLKFWARYEPVGALSVLEVTLSTNGRSWGDLTLWPTVTLFRMNTSATGILSTTWTEYTTDLKPFSGQTVYLGFWHHQPLTGDNIYLDNVSITSTSGNSIVFSESSPVADLNAGLSTTIEFSPWNAALGNYTIFVNTYLVGDQDSMNNELSWEIVVGYVPIPEFGVAAVPMVTIAVLFLFCVARSRFGKRQRCDR